MARTHCKQGHRFSVANTGYHTATRADGTTYDKRHCRICRRRQQREASHRKRRTTDNTRPTFGSPAEAARTARIFALEDALEIAPAWQQPIIRATIQNLASQPTNPHKLHP